MSPAELEDHFEVFELSADATIDDLDENYHHLSLELHKKKRTDPAYVQREQQKYDNTYYVLLQHFIREDCKEGQDRRTWKLAFNDIGTRRYDPGVRKSLFKDENDDIAMRRKSTEDLFDLARRGADTDTDSDDDEDEDTDEDRAKDKANEDAEGEEEEEDEDANSSKEPQADPRTPTKQNIRNRVFELVETSGNIFDAPNGSVIVHAVNCQGVWGNGFAAELKTRYPDAYAEYSHWCEMIEPRTLLVGKCLLIKPPRTDYCPEGQNIPCHWIACLFTSLGYGRPDPAKGNPGRDDKETIDMHTDSALIDLRTELNKEVLAGRMSMPEDLYSPKFNAGNFGVPWENTRWLIEMCFAGYPGRWTVMSPPLNHT